MYVCMYVCMYLSSTFYVFDKVKEFSLVSFYGAISLMCSWNICFQTLRKLAALGRFFCHSLKGENFCCSLLVFQPPKSLLKGVNSFRVTPFQKGRSN